MGTFLLPLAVLSTLLITQVASLCNDETQFDCKVGTNRRCIPLEWQCDNVPDCENGSDEETCAYLKKCDHEMMMCRDGSCISSTFKCDGEADCAGGSDEHGCAGMDLSHLRPPIRGYSEESREALEHFRFLLSPPSSVSAEVTSLCNEETQFDCKVGSKQRCIPIGWQCDNVPDCENGSDEETCAYLHTCNRGMFICRDGACLEKAFKCDGEEDCLNGEDEYGCAGMDLSHLRSSIHSEKSRGGLEHFHVSEVHSHVEKCEFPKYKCASSPFCLIPFAVCDGAEDCPQGDDEKNCHRPVSCSEGQTMCSNGLQCIPKPWICDGEEDCEDGSDESSCEY